MKTPATRRRMAKLGVAARGGRWRNKLANRNARFSSRRPPTASSHIGAQSRAAARRRAAAGDRRAAGVFELRHVTALRHDAASICTRHKAPAARPAACSRIVRIPCARQRAAAGDEVHRPVKECKPCHRMRLQRAGQRPVLPRPAAKAARKHLLPPVQPASVPGRTSSKQGSHFLFSTGANSEYRNGPTE